MTTSPFADWYGDFVITFTGIENDSFTADGCYLAGHYGSFGWVKVPVDGMTIEEGVRYPVMLGVGMGQKYDYICSGVEDFKCAMYIPEDILEANPNIQVKLELAIVDNSKGSDDATSALVNNENVYSVNKHIYDAEDFVIAPAVTIAHYGQNLRLQDLIKIGYYFSVTTDAEIAEVGALLWTAEQYAAETDFTVNSTVARKYQNLKASSGYYSIETDGVYAQNLDQVYYMIPYVVTVNGDTHYGEPKEYSALDYIEKAYTLTTVNPNTKSLAIDLVNYATAARVYFSYVANMELPTTPFNSMLSEADRVVEWNDSLLVQYPDVQETGMFVAEYYGRNINLLDVINIGIYYKNATDIEGGYYWTESNYSSNTEHNATTKTGNTIVERQSGNYVKLIVSNIYAYNIYDNYYVRPYNAEGELADTIGTSVAGYLTQVINLYKDSSEAEKQAFVEVAKAMLVYGDNARNNPTINK